MMTPVLCAACGAVLCATSDERFARFVVSSLCRACAAHPPQRPGRPAAA